MRMINRMVDPTSGRVHIDGDDVAGLDPVRLRRSVGYVMQASGLLPHRTVLDNITTVPVLRGTAKREARERAHELMETVGLDAALADRYPAQLSGGQQQRVGVARGLAADPNILLMDEPFGAVDPIVRRELQQELQHLQRDLRKTIVFVTHDVDEAFLLGDRVVILRPAGSSPRWAPRRRSSPLRPTTSSPVSSAPSAVRAPSTSNTSTDATWWSTPTVGPPACSPGSGPRELDPGELRCHRRLHRRPPGAGPAADPDRLPPLASAGQARQLPRLAAHFGHHRLLPDVRDPLPATVRAAAGSDRHRRAQPREHHHRAVAVRARAHCPSRPRPPPILIAFLRSLPLAKLANSRGWLRTSVTTGSSLMYAIPSLPLFVLLPGLIGTGVRSPANIIIALSLYGLALMVPTASDAFR